MSVTQVTKKVFIAKKSLAEKAKQKQKFCPITTTTTTTTIDVFVQSIGTNMAIGVKSVKSFCDVRKYVLQKQAMIVKLKSKNKIKSYHLIL